MIIISVQSRVDSSGDCHTFDRCTGRDVVMKGSALSFIVSHIL